MPTANPITDLGLSTMRQKINASGLEVRVCGLTIRRFVTRSNRTRFECTGVRIMKLVRCGRTIQIHPNHDALVRQREKQRNESMRATLKQRGSTVEPVFG